MFYAYIHYRADDRKPFYVGKGTGRRAWSKENRSDWWHRAAQKHGVNIQIVEDGLSNEEACSLEIFLIASFRAIGAPLVNMTDGGDGQRKGWVPSDETRRRMSESGRGRKKPEGFGFEASRRVKSFHERMTERERAERSRKISEATRARMQDHDIRTRFLEAVRKEDHVMKQSSRLAALHAQPEMRQRMRDKIHARMCRPFICVETGRQFLLQGDAALWLQSLGHQRAHQVAVSRALTGKAKSAYGFHWKFVHEVTGHG